MTRTAGFVVSHPFRRNKRKDGTDCVERACAATALTRLAIGSHVVNRFTLSCAAIFQLFALSMELCMKRYLAVLALVAGLAFVAASSGAQNSHPRAARTHRRGRNHRARALRGQHHSRHAQQGCRTRPRRRRDTASSAYRMRPDGRAQRPTARMSTVPTA